MARYDDASLLPRCYAATGPYPNRPFRFKNTEPPFFELGNQPKGRCITRRRGPGGSTNQECPEVVDVGEGRPGNDEVAERREEAVGVVAVEHRPRRQAQRRGARAGCSGETKAPAFSSLPSMPSVSAASTRTFGSPCKAMAQPSRNSVPRPPRPDAPGRTVTVVSPPDEHHAGPGERLAAPGDLPASAAWTLPTSRDSPSISSPRMCASMPAARAAAAAALERSLRRGDDVHRVAGEGRVAGLGRLQLAALEPAPGSRRAPRSRSGPAPPARRRRWSDRAPSGRCRWSRRIAGHVAHQQAHDLRRRAGARQPAALDRREMLPDAVHLVDRGAALQQRPVDRLLLVEAHALGGQGEQRRGAAGDQAEDEVVLAQAAGERADPCRGAAAGFVGHRMGRLDDLDPVEPLCLRRERRRQVVVAGDDQAADRRPGRPGAPRPPRPSSRRPCRRRGPGCGLSRRRRQERAIVAAFGRAAATAASNSERRKDRGSSAFAGMRRFSCSRPRSGRPRTTPRLHRCSLRRSGRKGPASQARRADRRFGAPPVPYLPPPEAPALRHPVRLLAATLAIGLLFVL